MILKPLISVIGEDVVDELDKNSLTKRQFAKISELFPSQVYVNSTFVSQLCLTRTL